MICSCPKCKQEWQHCDCDRVYYDKSFVSELLRERDEARKLAGDFRNYVRDSAAIEWDDGDQPSLNLPWEEK